MCTPRDYANCIVGSAVLCWIGVFVLIEAAATGCAPCRNCSDYDSCVFVAETESDICTLRFFADGENIPIFDRRVIGDEPCETTTPVECFVNEKHPDNLYLGQKSDQRPFHEQCPQRAIVGTILCSTYPIACVVFIMMVSNAPLKDGEGAEASQAEVEPPQGEEGIEEIIMEINI